MRKMRELFAHDVQVHNALDNQADLCYALFNESSSMSEKARTLWDELVHTERQRELPIASSLSVLLLITTLI